MTITNSGPSIISSPNQAPGLSATWSDPNGASLVKPDGSLLTPNTQNGNLLSFQILTGVGPATYTPTPGTTRIQVVAIGGGGGSGGVKPDANNTAASGGGGSGAWCGKYITSLLASYAYSCGAAGAAGVAAPGPPAGSGGNTTFGSGPVILTAGGGGGSPAVDNSGKTIIQQASGGVGAITSSGGDWNSFGNAGSPALSGPTASFAFSTYFTGGIGGSTPWGAGGVNYALTLAVAASGYGAGGGGAVAYSGGAAGVGFVGTAGAILIWEYS